jgi:hypothetical protein
MFPRAHNNRAITIVLISLLGSGQWARERSYVLVAQNTLYIKNAILFSDLSFSALKGKIFPSRGCDFDAFFDKNTKFFQTLIFIIIFCPQKFQIWCMTGGLCFSHWII